jgi:hypothetical protein
MEKSEEMEYAPRGVGVNFLSNEGGGFYYSKVNSGRE